MAKVVIGVDPHKRINAVVVLSAKGKVLSRTKFENRAGGFRQLRAFSLQWRPRTWAIEGCNGVGKHLAQRLVAEGERVVHVSTPPGGSGARLRRRQWPQERRHRCALHRPRRAAHAGVAIAETETGLIRLFGVGPVTTARVLGEVGDVARFRSRHHFASYNGTAPVDLSSAGPPAYRLNLKGNRKLNHAIHMVAITQVRNDCPGRAYYVRKQAEGKTPKEALRALKRRISDVIYRQLLADAAAQRGPGGQVGTTPRTSVAGPTPMAGSSVKLQPGPRRETTPIPAIA